jgi:hypothetical protein
VHYAGSNSNTLHQMVMPVRFCHVCNPIRHDCQPTDDSNLTGGTLAYDRILVSSDAYRMIPGERVPMSKPVPAYNVMRLPSRAR